MSEDLEAIELKKFADEDIGILYSWINDSLLQEWSSPFRYVAQAEHKEWFDRCRAEEGNAITLGIYVGEGELIGYCSLCEIDRLNQSAILQIKICSKRHRNRGIGTRCITMLCSHAYDNLNLRRIELRVFSGNERAIRVYKKCGFEIEGVMREAYFLKGKFQDVIIMSRLREMR